MTRTAAGQAAWCGQPGCEAIVLSNLILGRDDQIGCPAFTPVDALEALRRGSTWLSELSRPQTRGAARWVDAAMDQGVPRFGPALAGSPTRSQQQTPPAPRILAATVAELPELDGAQIATAAMHHRDHGTIPHLLASHKRAEVSPR